MPKGFALHPVCVWGGRQSKGLQEVTKAPSCLPVSHVATYGWLQANPTTLYVWGKGWVGDLRPEGIDPTCAIASESTPTCCLPHPPTLLFCPARSMHLPCPLPSPPLILVASGTPDSDASTRPPRPREAHDFTYFHKAICDWYKAHTSHGTSSSRGRMCISFFLFSRFFFLSFLQLKHFHLCLPLHFTPFPFSCWRWDTGLWISGCLCITGGNRQEEGRWLLNQNKFDSKVLPNMLRTLWFLDQYLLYIVFHLLW